MTNFQAIQTSNLKRQPISKISLGHIIFPSGRIRVNIESSSTGIKNLALNNEFDLRSCKHYHHRIRRFPRGYTAKTFWKSNVQLYERSTCRTWACIQGCCLIWSMVYRRPGSSTRMRRTKDSHSEN